MGNINKDKIRQEEDIQIIEKFILMLKTSGYDRAQAREAVVCGIRGWKAKIVRRNDEGRGFYRNAASTLSARYKKKLTAKTSWYKKNSKNMKRKYEMDSEEQEELSERQALKRATRPPEPKEETGESQEETEEN